MNYSADWEAANELHAEIASAAAEAEAETINPRLTLHWHGAPVATEREILRVIVGSTVHGLALDGTDDLDLMGIYVERAEDVCGLDPLSDRLPSYYVARTQPDGARSGHGDVDLVVYSLRRYLKLVAAGNPSLLLPMFAPVDAVKTAHDPYAQMLYDLRSEFVTIAAGRAFLGYLRRQRDKLRGERGNRTKRPELIEAHGYDCHLDDTEFLTEQGWLRYDEIDDDALLATVNAAGEIEYQQPLGRVAKPYTGPIHYGRSRCSSWAVTPNHRMWVSKVQRGASSVNGSRYTPDRAAWGFRRADEIGATSWHARVAGARRREDWPEATDALLALVGAYVSEGCVGKRLTDGTPSVLRFEQKDEGRLHGTMALVGSAYPLRSYRYPDKRPVTTWTLADRDVAAEVVKWCGEGSAHKRLPEWVRFLSARQADVLLAALMSGDGTPCRTGGWIYYTISPGLAGDVQALSLSAGRRCNAWGPYPTGGMFQLLVQDPDDAREFEAYHASRHLTVEHVIDARIVCFTVPNERLVTRREGRVAMHGNTKFAGHALRLGLQGAELMVDGVITLPMPVKDRERVLRIRRGELSFEQVVWQLDRVERQLAGLVEQAREEQWWPEEADHERIRSVSAQMHRAYWHEVDDDEEPQS